MVLILSLIPLVLQALARGAGAGKVASPATLGIRDPRTRFAPYLAVVLCCAVLVQLYRKVLAARDQEWPSPIGLSLGIASVALVQIFVVLPYYWLLRHVFTLPFIQQKRSKANLKPFWPAILRHLSQPEGFLMLGAYLSGTWMYRVLPDSYYSFEGGVNMSHVLAQLLITDAAQTVMHMAEHELKHFYRKSHKPHHFFTSPQLVDAFDGSFYDTLFMILVPLSITSHLVHCNVWSYMAFGTIYGNYLCLIHSEYALPWGRFFRRLGIGTAADHHVHHKLFNRNFGHLFMYWDQLLGTYTAPTEVTKHFNVQDL